MTSLRTLAFLVLLAMAPQQPKDGSVEVMVRDSVTHRGIPAVRVTLVYFPADPANTVDAVFTDSEGRALIRNLAFGLYTLKLEREGYRGSSRAAANPNDISGIVRDSLDRPAQKTTVTLVPDAPRRENFLLYKRVTTDANGTFKIRGVAPGQYQLFAWGFTFPGSAEQNPEFLAKYEGKGVTVKATSGINVDVQLRLLPE